MLAMDREGNITVIELKRNKTPREVTAQTLDYASWVQNLSYSDIATIFSDKNSGKALEAAFAEKFNTNPPEKLNQSHQLIVVASELDTSTERIINYLSLNYQVPINAVFFRYYKDGSNEYLTRTWLIDPYEAEIKEAPNAKAETWNGRDFYCAFGDPARRDWEAARTYGFVSGGGGRWYSNTLSALFPGARVFACIPGSGYVGVGIVKEPVVSINDFNITIDDRLVPLLDAPLKSRGLGLDADNPDLAEYVVRVEWIKTLPISQAFWVQGMFANQNTACRLRNRFTLEKLYQYFKLED